MSLMPDWEGRTLRWPLVEFLQIKCSWPQELHFTGKKVVVPERSRKLSVPHLLEGGQTWRIGRGAASLQVKGTRVKVEKGTYPQGSGQAWDLPSRGSLLTVQPPSPVQSSKISIYQAARENYTPKCCSASLGNWLHLFVPLFPHL